MNFITAKTHELPESLHASLSAYRYGVFVKRLCWELPSAPGREQDQFDHSETMHVMATNDVGEIVGYGRLLPCDGPYLLESLFPQLLNGMPVPRGPNVWELSRFAAMDVEGTTQRTSRCEHMAERVLLESLRCCAASGVDTLLAVSTLPVERLMQRAGVDVHRMGPPYRLGDQWILGFVIRVNQRSLSALEAYESAACMRATRTKSSLRSAAQDAAAPRHNNRLNDAEVVGLAA